MNYRKSVLLRNQTLCRFTEPLHHHNNCSFVPVAVDIASIQHGLISSPSSSVLRVRGRVESSRICGKLAFIQFRQPPFYSIQVVTSGADLTRQVKAITPESIVDVTGTLVSAARPVLSTSCSNYEFHAERIDVISKADSPLPFPIKDRQTKLDTRLNHRFMDMRTPLMTAMLRVVSLIGQAFRIHLLSRDFVEIHTPKLVSTASEGGSAVFALDYFGQPGYLAQSPQLYKQLALMGDAMRVFEIGPVFRSEKSFTHRHLTEFIGLDAELVIDHSYTEVLDVLERLVCDMIHQLQSEHAALLRRVREALTEADVSVIQRPFVGRQDDEETKTEGERVLGKETRSDTDTKTGGGIVFELSEETLAAYHPLLRDATELRLSTDCYNGRVSACGMENTKYYQPKVLRLAFDDAVRLLVDNKVTEEPLTDFTLLQERRLGDLVRERYGVDVYIVDKFPVASRPFYTMPHPTRPGATCGFDMYLRGEEICSGAQRVHDPALLLKNMERLRVDATALKDYVDAFRYGAWPHGGFGLGLERIALFLLGARDIRQVSLFPRDPKRLAP